MGKIYEALQRSGKSFYQKDIQENALTSMEKKALGRAGRYYKLKEVSKRRLSQNGQTPSLKKTDSLLMDFGLSESQITQQTIKELNQSLRRIDGFIAQPESFMKQKFRDTVYSETNFKLHILPILLDRRRFVLDTYDELAGRMKNYDLRRLVNAISDKNIKSSMEKILYDLQMKDSVLKKEYQKIEKSRLNIYSEQQKISSMNKDPGEKRNKASKYLPGRDSLIIRIMGFLLILIALSIAIAPFVKISVPNILNSTFLIILGFFFGHGMGRFTSLKETKK